MKSLPTCLAAALVCALCVLDSEGAPNITATQDDATAAATRKLVGETITYTTTISNTAAVGAGNDATGLSLTNATPANTTDAGSVSISPVAFDDTYPQTVLPNIGINSGNIPYSVISNDFTGTPAVTTIASFTQPAHGTVTMVTSGANIGQFTYEPAAGYTGSDSFTYTLTNSVGSSVGTVSLSVAAAPVIWFVNPNAASTGTGTLASPFKTLAEAITAIGNNANQRIFLYTSGTPQSGSFVLKSGGWLVGQAALATDFDTLMGIAPGSGANARPAINNATKPSLTNSAGHTITLGEGDNIFGVAIANTGGGFAISGSSINAGTIGNATTADVTLSSSGTSSGALSLTNGSGVFNINAPITTVAGRSVSITSRTGGTVAINSAVSDSAVGISLTSNTGATINFAGGLALSTAANTAFNATGGGTVNVTQNNTTIVNTITTTTATVALNIANTTIGGSGVTFRSVSAGTGVDSAGTGIILDNTGSTAGLTVTGNGSAGTGGTIQHKNGADIHSVNTDGTFIISGTTGVGIFLRNTKNPSFAWMQLNDFSNLGILGSTVTGLTLDHIITSGVNGSNTNVNEAVMHFDNLTGSASITNSTIQGGISDNFSLINTSGTLNRITFNTVTFGPMDSGNTNGDDSLFIEARNSATINATVQGCNLTSARGDIFQFDLTDTAHGDLIFKSNTVNNVHPNVVVGGGGLTLSGGGSVSAAPVMTYDIGGATAPEGNTFRGARGDALLIVFQTGNGSATGKIRNNVFGVAAIDQSGAREASDIEIRTVGRAAQTTVIDSNQTYQYGNNGIYIQMGDMSVVGTGGTVGALNATISNNIVSNFSSNPATRAGIHVNLGTTTNDSYQACVDIFNNNAPNSGSTDTSAGSDFIVRQRQLTTMRLPNYGGTSSDVAAVAAYIKARNTNGASSSVFAATPSGGGGYTGGAGSCTQPPLLFAPGGVEAATIPCSLIREKAVVAQLPDSSAKETRGLSQPRKIDAQPVSLSQAELDAVTAVARERWQETGLTSDQVARLRAMKFEVAELSGLRVGEADGDQIRVDADAGGNGWFIGTGEDLFANHVSATRAYSDGSKAPAGHLDLLTAILHEMGHALGLNDTYAERDRDNLMYGFLTRGERRVPVTGQGAGAAPDQSSTPHFLSTPVNIGTLPAGKSVKVVFSVTVGPIIGNPQQTSSQGSVTGSNFATVQTSDAVAGSGATVTLLGIAPAFTSANATTFTVGTAGNFNVAANGAPAPAFSFTGSLPSGVTLSAAGVLSGTPAAATGGTYPITITANNGIAPNATQSFTLTVNQPPAITSANATTFVVGTNGSFTLTKTGFPAPTLSQTGTLPGGVTFTAATGVLSGTPAAGTGGSYPISFKASNGVGSDAVQSFTLTVNQAPAITSANSTTFTAGAAGAFNVTATGFPSPTIGLTNGTLPGGVNFGTGSLAGTPTAFGTFPLTFTASNGVGSNATQAFSLVVNPSAQDVKSKPKISANAGGGFRLDFLGNPGTQYTVQFSPSLSAPNWQTLELKVADPQGMFFSIDTPPAGTIPRFYRAIIP